MKIVLFTALLFASITANAQDVGPSNNVGREYGNPKMPIMVSHLAGANMERLKRVNRNSRHSVFTKILCFRKVCRIQSGHSASLNTISFRKHKKNIAKNAKKGLYKDIKIDTTYKRKLEPKPAIVDSSIVKPVPPPIQSDSLIVLGAELLFEPNKSTLRTEHYSTLNSIVDYLRSHPERSVTVSGHTDNSGQETHNLALSKRRAEVVAEYLVSSGISISRIETSGLGSTTPITSNTTDEGRKKNRRVELLIHSVP